MAEIGEAAGTGCLIGCGAAIFLCPALVIHVIRNQGRAKRTAWAIIRSGHGSTADIDACISALSAAQDTESQELVRRLMEMKGAQSDEGGRLR